MLVDFNAASELVRLSYDIDSATSYELDILGRIVVQARNFESFITLEVNQLGDGLQLGDGVQLSGQTGRVSQNVSDDIYRTLIRAKIAKNNSDGTTSSVLASVAFITGVNDLMVVDRENMSFGVVFVNALSDVSRFILNNFDIVPRPQGVEFLGFVEEEGLASLGAGLQLGDDDAQLTRYF